MTLLEATTTVIETIKERQLDEDPHVRLAVRRMEKRLEVLKYRHQKRQLAIRHRAFHEAAATFGGGVFVKQKHKEVVILCQKCGKMIRYDMFLKNGSWNGMGKIQSLRCPHCGVMMVNDPKSALFLVHDEQTKKSMRL